MTDLLSPDAVFFLSMLVRSTLILLIASLIATALRAMRAAAATRHVTWLVAFAVLAALPLLSHALPPFVIPLPHAIASIYGPDLSTPGDHPRGGGDLAIWIWGFYAAGAGAMLARLAFARAALATLWRQAQHETGPANLADLAQRADVQIPVVLRFAGEQIAPMTWGNRILLPAGAADWPQERQRDVLLHELSHMARRDSLTQTFAAIVRALFWFSPAAWYALRALRLDQEQACDERVIAGGAEPIAYAQTLFDIAASLRAPALGVGVSTAMVQRSDLEQRVLAVLNPIEQRAITASRAAMLAAMALASVTFVAAARPMDEAHILSPLGPLAPIATELSRPLPPLTTPLRMPDDPSEPPHR
jgi:hypothetical protein